MDTDWQREREVVAHTHKKTPLKDEASCSGAQQQWLEKLPQAAFESGSSFMVQWSCCKDTQPMFRAWKENKPLVCPCTPFFWTDEWIIFLKMHSKHVWSFKPISFHTVNCIFTTEKVSIETWSVRGRFQSYYSSAMWEIPPEPSSELQRCFTETERLK